MITKIFNKRAKNSSFFNLHFSIFHLTLLLLSSCADLEQTSLSSIDRENFYQSKQDIETAINGIYQEFTVDGFYGMFNNQSIYINDLQTDYVKAGAQTNSAHIRELSNFAVQPTNLLFWRCAHCAPRW